MTTDVTSRAVAAYFGKAAKEGWHAFYPDPELSGPRIVDGKEYVVIENSCETLAVYRVRPNGRLKFLRRPPRELAPRE